MYGVLKQARITTKTAIVLALSVLLWNTSCGKPTASEEALQESCSRQSQEFVRKATDWLREYDDVVEVAQMAPAKPEAVLPQISNIKQMRRHMEDLHPPSCANAVRSLLLLSIDTFIESQAIWMSDRAFSGINSLEQRSAADDQLEAARNALKVLGQSQTNLNPLTKDSFKQVFTELNWKTEVSDVDKNISVLTATATPKLILEAMIRDDVVFVYRIRSRGSSDRSLQELCSKGVEFLNRVMPESPDRSQWINELNAKLSSLSLKSASYREATRTLRVTTGYASAGGRNIDSEVVIELFLPGQLPKSGSA